MQKPLNWVNLLLIACLIFAAWANGVNMGVNKASDVLSATYSESIEHVVLQQQESCAEDFMHLGKSFALATVDMVELKCPEIAEQIVKAIDDTSGESEK